jgi:hypothetical protein
MLSLAPVVEAAWVAVVDASLTADENILLC